MKPTQEQAKRWLWAVVGRYGKGSAFVDEVDDAIDNAMRAEREACAAQCDAYSKHLIATGKPNTPSEWEAHGAEACANLLRGNNEFGDAPTSEFFGGSYAAAIRSRCAK